MRQNLSSFPIHVTAEKRVFSLLAAAMVGLALFATPSFADEEMDQAQIKYRQTLMGGVGANMGGIGTILKNQLQLPGHVESHSRQIAESSKLIAAAFKSNLADGATDAKPEIWSDWAGFEKAIADLDAAANTLADAAASGDGAAIGPAVKALGKSCGGCHETYRKPKEESYKNQ